MFDPFEKNENHLLPSGLEDNCRLMLCRERRRLVGFLGLCVVVILVFRSRLS
jgi:hypothetical protein